VKKKSERDNQGMYVHRLVVVVAVACCCRSNKRFAKFPRTRLVAMQMNEGKEAEKRPVTPRVARNGWIE